MDAAGPQADKMPKLPEPRVRHAQAEINSRPRCGSARRHLSPTRHNFGDDARRSPGLIFPSADLPSLKLRRRTMWIGSPSFGLIIPDAGSFHACSVTITNLLRIEVPAASAPTTCDISTRMVV